MFQCGKETCLTERSYRHRQITEGQGNKLLEIQWITLNETITTAQSQLYFPVKFSKLATMYITVDIRLFILTES